MQPAQHRQCRFTVQLAILPIVAFEDELAYEDDNVRTALALVFVRVVGLGPFARILAIACPIPAPSASGFRKRSKQGSRASAKR